MIKEIKEWLQNNPRTKEEKVELELAKMGIDIYHVLSLVWDKTTRKYTNEFIIYKVQEIMEMFVNNLPESMPVEVVEERLAESMDIVEKSNNTIEDIVGFFGAEVDNYPKSDYGLTIDLKLACLLKCINLIGISNNQIFEKYN